MFKRTRTVLVLVLVLSFSTVSIGNEWANYYFPDTPGSYWTYQDQDGNELTRYAIEPETIDGETYRAFSYEPALENWADFEHYVQPYYYQVGDDSVAFFVGTEIENSLKARMIQEMDEVLPLMREQMMAEIPEGTPISIDINFDVEDIEVDAQDYFYLLPTPITFNEEWTALELNVTFTLTINIQGAPIEIPGGNSPTITTYTSIVEIGEVTGTETVDTPAGTFEDCLIIEYQTNEITEIAFSVPEAQQEDPEEQEASTITTVWLAPNVGIVKFKHEHPDSDEARVEFGLPPEGEKTLELTNYEIKDSPSEVE